MKIIPLSIPTPFYVGAVNVYLIKEDPVTLIDVGPKTSEATVALKHSLRQNGLEFSGIKRILLTHTHEDHCGLAKSVRDESKNAEILVHNWETGHLFGRLSQNEHEHLLKRAGVPEDVLSQMKLAYEKASLLTDSLAQTEYKKLHDEMEIEFESGMLKVLHTPGHTPGSCSFLREADRTLFCGDCVLKGITPNPMISVDPLNNNERFKSLTNYLSSLEKIRNLAPTLIYGGHGEPINDFEEVYRRYIFAFNERHKAILSYVTADGASAWQIAQKIFPSVKGETIQTYLAVSETAAHLDHAESLGLIKMESRERSEFYLN